MMAVLMEHFAPVQPYAAALCLNMIQELHLIRPDHDDALQAVLDELRGRLGFDLLMLNIITNNSKYFRAWSGELPSELVILREWQRPEHSMCLDVVCSKAPVIVSNFHDIPLEHRTAKHAPYFGYGMQSYLGVPLIYNGTAVGVLAGVTYGRPRYAQPSDIGIMRDHATLVLNRLVELSGVYRHMPVPRYERVEDLIRYFMAHEDDRINEIIEDLRGVTGADCALLLLKTENSNFMAAYTGRCPYSDLVMSARKMVRDPNESLWLRVPEGVAVSNLEDPEWAPLHWLLRITARSGVVLPIMCPTSPDVMIGTITIMNNAPDEKVKDKIEVVSAYAQDLTDRLMEILVVQERIQNLPEHLQAHPAVQLGHMVWAFSSGHINLAQLHGSIRSLIRAGLDPISARFALKSNGIPLGPLAVVVHTVFMLLGRFMAAETPLQELCEVAASLCRAAT